MLHGACECVLTCDLCVLSQMHAERIRAEKVAEDAAALQARRAAKKKLIAALPAKSGMKV